MNEYVPYGKLNSDSTVLLVVDIQERLVRAMSDPVALVAQADRLIKGAQALDIPVIVSEQYPQGLGPTVAELNSETARVFEKDSFSCMASADIRHAIAQTECRDVLLAGIECHVCVYQTARDLVSTGYRVHLVTDAVASRKPANCRLGIEKIACVTGTGELHLTGVETCLFDMLGSSRHPAFKTISALVK